MKNSNYAIVPEELRTTFPPMTQVMGICGRPGGTVIAADRLIGFVPDSRIKLGDVYIVSNTFEIVPKDKWENYLWLKEQVTRKECSLKAVQVMEAMIATGERRKKKQQRKADKKSKTKGVKELKLNPLRMQFTKTL